MREKPSGGSSISYRSRSAFDRRNPLYWLIFGGVLLIASIVIGTAITVLNFRERALNNRERELGNTVLLLARHFDQQLHDFEVIQRDVVRRIERSGVASPEEFRRQISSERFHRNLSGVADGLSDAAGIHVFAANGQLGRSPRSTLRITAISRISQPMTGRHASSSQRSTAASRRDGRPSSHAKWSDRTDSFWVSFRETYHLPTLRGSSSR